MFITEAETHLMIHELSLKLANEYKYAVLNQPRRLSRNVWVNYIINAVTRCSIVLSNQKIKNMIYCMRLVHDLEIRSLRVVMTEINGKKCQERTTDLNMTFSIHFYWRLLQAHQTESIEDIAPILHKVAHIVQKEKTFLTAGIHTMKDMILIIKDIGVVVVCMDDVTGERNDILYTMKTFIDKDHLNGRHKYNYNKLMNNKNQFYQVLPGNAENFKLNNELSGKEHY